MTPLERHLIDMGLLPKPQPKPPVARQWGGWKPTYKGEECPW